MRMINLQKWKMTNLWITCKFMSKNDTLKKSKLWGQNNTFTKKLFLQIYKTRNCNLEICEKQSVSWRKNWSTYKEKIWIYEKDKHAHSF